MKIPASNTLAVVQIVRTLQSYLLAKEQARLSLCVISVEVIGAMKAYGAVAQDPELLARASFTGSTVCAGKVNEVVARCKNVWQAATDNAAALVKYGIPAARSSPEHDHRQI